MNTDNDARFLRCPLNAIKVTRWPLRPADLRDYRFLGVLTAVEGAVAVVQTYGAYSGDDLQIALVRRAR